MIKVMSPSVMGPTGSGKSTVRRTSVVESIHSYTVSSYVAQVDVRLGAWAMR